MPESCSHPFALKQHLVNSYSESGAGLGTGSTQESKTDPSPTLKNLAGVLKIRKRQCRKWVIFVLFFIIFTCNLNPCRTGRIDGNSALWSVSDRETEIGIKADFLAFPCGSAGKESTCNGRDLDSTSALGRSSREGKGYPHQYSGLENSTDCIAHGVAKSRTGLSDFHLHFPS